MRKNWKKVALLGAMMAAVTFTACKDDEPAKEDGGSIPVTGVTLDKVTLSLIEGGTETLTATVAPDSATEKNVTWSSSNAEVATVSSTGAVAAKAAGTATITAKAGDKTATCEVTVNAAADVVAVTGVTLNKATLTLAVDSTETLTATVAPANATNQSVTWSSSNAAAATVSGGVVMAVAAGTAMITVTTDDGSKTATCEVTVNAESSSGITDGAGVSDADGNTYRTKVYNGVEWTIDNSKKTTGITGCTYDPINRTNIDGVDYGYLYSWNCAAQACPEGWNLPTDEDFTNLEAALNAGGASAWADWNSGSFLAGRGLNGSYDSFQGSCGFWWNSSSSYRFWGVDSGHKSGYFYTLDSSYSFSVRCVKK